MKLKKQTAAQRKDRRCTAIIWIFVLIWVLPFVLTLLGSLQPRLEIQMGNFTLFPETLTLENYNELLVQERGVAGFKHSILNSLKVGISTCLLTVFVATLGAYSMSHYKFRGSKVISKSMLLLYAFPTILLISPIFGVLAKLNLIDSLTGLVLVHSTLVSPFCVWLLKSFFDDIPKEIEEAANIDGASRWTVMWRIIFPLAAPGVLAIGIYALIFSWGEYTFSSIIIHSGSNKTVPMALAANMAQQDQQWARMLTGCVCNFLPLIFMFMPLLKHFLKGFTAGAVKQ